MKNIYSTPAIQVTTLMMNTCILQSSNINDYNSKTIQSGINIHNSNEVLSKENWFNEEDEE